MSCKELRRALARVESGELKLEDAAVLMGMSYRQSKRLAKRDREGGTQGLKHGSAGRESNRRKSKKFRERVLRLVGKKYSGEEGERFGPTLAGSSPHPPCVPAYLRWRRPPCSSTPRGHRSSNQSWKLPSICTSSPTCSFRSRRLRCIRRFRARLHSPSDNIQRRRVCAFTST